MSQLAERFAEAGEPLASGQVRQQAPESWRPRDSQPGRGRELPRAGVQQPKAAGPEQPLPEQVLVRRKAELRAATRPREQMEAAEAEQLAWPEQPE